MKRTHSNIFDPKEEICIRTEEIENLIYSKVTKKSEEFEYMEENINIIIQVIEKHRILHMSNKMTEKFKKFEEEYIRCRGFAKHISKLTLDNPLKYPFLFFILMSISEITDYLYTKEDTIFGTQLLGDNHHIHNNLFFIGMFINNSSNQFQFAFEKRSKLHNSDLNDTYIKYIITDDCLKKILEYEVNDTDSENE